MRRCGLAVVSFLLLSHPSFADDSHVGPVKDFLGKSVAAWLQQPEIVDAIKSQNAENAKLAQGDIDALDKKWRAETEASDHPMIDATLAKPLSQFLKQKQEESGGVITEMFVMDAKGLNVAQSDMTSDYWQGDEAKFQKSFGAGADAVFVDEVEKDESTQTLQSQASMTVKDPATGEPIGAITIGINIDKL